MQLDDESTSNPCPSNSGTSDGPNYGNPLGTTVAALGASLGIGDGGSYKNNPGFGESVAAWTVAGLLIPGGGEEKAGVEAAEELVAVAPDLENLSNHILNSMTKRGWSTDEIRDAFENGESYPATDLTNGGTAATRYVNPTTGKSVVINNTTGGVIHVGGPGFKY